MHKSRSASSTVAYSILQFVIKYRSQQKMLIGTIKKGEPFFSILLFTLAVRFPLPTYCFLLTAFTLIRVGQNVNKIASGFLYAGEIVTK